MAITTTQQTHEGSSSAPGELLVCGCQPEDVALLESAYGPESPFIRIVDDPAELARLVVLRPPMAVVLGLRKRDRARIKIIPVLRAASRELPVIVIADEASLELERRARQEGIFYYFVRPLVAAEMQAVVADLRRRTARRVNRIDTSPDTKKKRSQS